MVRDTFECGSVESGRFFCVACCTQHSKLQQFDRSPVFLVFLNRKLVRSLLPELSIVASLCFHTTSRPDAPYSIWKLIPIVSESLVGFCHAVGFFPLANGTACFVGCIHQFVGQFCCHRSTGSSSSKADQPAEGEGCTAIGTHFHRHLIGGASHPAGFYFYEGRSVFDCFFKQVQRFCACSFLDRFEGIVDDAASNGFFAVLHDPPHHHAHQTAVVD